MVKLKILDKLFRTNQSNAAQKPNEWASSSGTSPSQSSSTSSSTSSCSSPSVLRSKLYKSTNCLTNHAKNAKTSAENFKRTNSGDLLLFGGDLTGTESIFSDILNENFVCNCCLETLRNPVTLLCGHSFCQLCLADWYLISSKKICPVCRQEWHGVPKVNQTLKTTIRKLIKQDSLMMCTDNFGAYSDKLSKEDEKKIKTFEQKCSCSLLPGGYFTSTDFNYRINYQEQRQRINEHLLQQSHRRNNNINLYNFLIGILVGMLVAVMAFLLGWLMFGSAKSYSIDLSNVGLMRKKYLKPTELWTVNEVQEWFYALGPWTTKIANIALVAKIDGFKLLQINETHLEQSPFSVKEQNFRTLLIESIRVLKCCEVKTINFWDLKNSNRFQFVFFSLFFESYPRLTCLYYYLFDFEATFKLLSRLFEKNFINLNDNDFIYLDNIKKSFIYRDLSIFSAQDGASSFNAKGDRRILFYLLKLPYIRLKNILNIFFYDTNRFTCFFISFNCLLFTLIDLVFIIDIVRSILGLDVERVKHLCKSLLVNYIKSLTFIAFFYLFWNLIPNIFIDLFYLYFLFVKIFFNVNMLMCNVRNFFESIAHYFIRPNH